MKKAVYLFASITFLVILTGCCTEPIFISISADNTSCNINSTINIEGIIDGNYSLEDISWSAPDGGEIIKTGPLKIQWKAPSVAGEYMIRLLVKKDCFILNNSTSETISITVSDYENISQITAEDLSSKIKLTWENPDSDLFLTSTIFRSEIGSEEGVSDFTKIHEGTGTLFYDSDVTPGRTYYYSFYSQYKNGEKSKRELYTYFYPYQTYLASITTPEFDISDFSYNKFSYTIQVPYATKTATFTTIERSNDLSSTYRDNIGNEEPINSGVPQTQASLSLGSNNFLFKVSQSSKPWILKEYTVKVIREHDIIHFDQISLKTNTNNETYLNISNKNITAQVEENTTSFQLKASYTGDATLWIDTVESSENTWSKDIPISNDSKTCTLQLKDIEDTVIETYTVTVKKVPVIPRLTGLSFSQEGFDLADFSPDKTFYTKTVEKTLNSINVIPKVSDSSRLGVIVAGHETFPGNPSPDIQIDEGNTTITIRVYEKANSENYRDYSIVLTRPPLSSNAYLSSLSNSVGAPIPFDKDTYSYQLTLPYDQQSITISAASQDETTAISFSIDNNTPTTPIKHTASYTLPLSTGSSKSIKVISQAESGTKKEYIINIAVNSAPDLTVLNPSNEQYVLKNLDTIPVTWRYENLPSGAENLDVDIFLYNETHSIHVGSTGLSNKYYEIALNTEELSFIKRYYESHPDKFRVKVVVSSETSLYDYSSYFKIEPTYYNISLFVKNVNSNSFSDVYVKLYRANDNGSYSYISTLDNFNASMARNISVTEGNYRAAVFHELGSKGPELWCVQNFTVTQSQNQSITFQRNMPTIDSINIINGNPSYEDRDIEVTTNSYGSHPEIKSTKVYVKIYDGSSLEYSDYGTTSNNYIRLDSYADQASKTPPNGKLSIHVQVKCEIDKIDGSNGTETVITDNYTNSDINSRFIFFTDLKVRVNNIYSLNSNIDNWTNVMVELFRTTDNINFSKVTTLRASSTRYVTFPDLDYSKYSYRICVFYNTPAKYDTNDTVDEFWGLKDIAKDTNYVDFERYMPCFDSINYAYKTVDIRDDVEALLVWKSMNYHRSNTKYDIDVKVYMVDTSTNPDTRKYSDTQTIDGNDSNYVKLDSYKDQNYWYPKKPSSLQLFGHIYAEAQRRDGPGTFTYKTDSYDWTNIVNNVTGF